MSFVRSLVTLLQLQCDQMLNKEAAQFFQNLPKIVTIGSSFFCNVSFFKLAQKVSEIFGLFLKYKTFQKSPNMVTLLGSFTAAFYSWGRLLQTLVQKYIYFNGQVLFSLYCHLLIRHSS